MPSPAPEAAKSGEARSPSPPARPPIAQSAGPRATRLQTIFDSALEATIKKCTYKNFATCFPTPAQYASESLESVWKQLTDSLDHQCRAQFELILNERGVVPALNSLDDLLIEAKKHKDQAASNANDVPPPVPPHTLSPKELHHAHLLPFLTTHAANLSAQLTGTQTANVQLAESIATQRREIAALMAGLESAVRDLEAAAEMVGGAVEVQALSSEVGELEQDLRG